MIRRTLHHIYAIVVDDAKGHTLAPRRRAKASATARFETNIDARQDRSAIADARPHHRSCSIGLMHERITAVVFDRGGFQSSRTCPSAGRCGARSGVNFNAISWSWSRSRQQRIRRDRRARQPRGEGRQGRKALLFSALVVVGDRRARSASPSAKRAKFPKRSARASSRRTKSWSPCRWSRRPSRTWSHAHRRGDRSAQTGRAGNRRHRRRLDARRAGAGRHSRHPDQVARNEQPDQRRDGDLRSAQSLKTAEQVAALRGKTVKEIYA